MLQTQLPALLRLQLWQKLPRDPGLIGGVVGDEGIILISCTPVPPLGVVEKCHEEEEGIDNLPSQEMVDDGPQQGEEDQRSGGQEVEEAYVY